MYQRERENQEELEERKRANWGEAIKEEDILFLLLKPGGS